MEISNLPDKEFKVNGHKAAHQTAVKNGSSSRSDKQKKESVNTKKKHWKSLNQSSKNKKKEIKKCKDSLEDLWDNIKGANICVIGVLEGGEREKGAEILFQEIMAESFPKLGKKTDQIQKVQRVPNKMNPKQPIPRHIIIKKLKTRRKLKTSRAKQLFMYKRTPIRLSVDFSAQTLQAKREWHDMLKVLKERKLLPRIPYPAKLLKEN